jgi:hypothetical protein
LKKELLLRKIEIGDKSDPNDANQKRFLGEKVGVDLSIRSKRGL